MVEAKNMRRVLLYVRVSTKEQAEKVFSLQTQEKLLREYFKNDDVIEVIYDTTSGFKRDRDGILKLRKLLPVADIVGALNQNRLARDPGVMGVIKYWWEQENVKIIIITEKEEDEFIEDIKNVVAKKENVDRINNILRTKDTCFEMGRHIAKPPFGYFYDKNHKPSILKQDNNISIVKSIFALYQKKYGYLKIAKKLNLRERNGTFATIKIRNILKNPFYAGIVRYKGVFNKGIHKAIISEKDFFDLRLNKNEEEKVYKVYLKK